MKRDDVLYVACGPWLTMAWWKRLAATAWWWPQCLVVGLWASKYRWWRLALHRLRLRLYMTEEDDIDWEEYARHHTPVEVEAERAETRRYFGFPARGCFVLAAQSHHPRWLWYEDPVQIRRNSAENDYHVDWSGKCPRFYPFW